MFSIETNLVTIQGKGAWGVVQVGSVAFILGRVKTGGPRWYLSLFRPYSKQWFHWHR